MTEPIIAAKINRNGWQYRLNTPSGEPLQSLETRLLAHLYFTSRFGDHTDHILADLARETEEETGAGDPAQVWASLKRLKQATVSYTCLLDESLFFPVTFLAMHANTECITIGLNHRLNDNRLGPITMELYLIATMPEANHD